MPSKQDARPEKKTAYDAVIFTLFKPWRNLCTEFQNFDLNAFLPSCSPLTKHYIDNINALSASKEEAKRLAHLRTLEEQSLTYSNLPSQYCDPLSEEVLEHLQNDDFCHWSDDFTQEQLDHSLFNEQMNQDDDYISNAVRPLGLFLNATSVSPSVYGPEPDLWWVRSPTRGSLAGNSASYI
jgi:hypothetical protein